MDQNRVGENAFQIESVVNSCFHQTFSPSKLQIIDQFSYYFKIHVLIKTLKKDSFNYVVYFHAMMDESCKVQKKKHYQQVLWIL
jgi:hypothetical protein